MANKEFMDCFQAVDTSKINFAIITAEMKEWLLHDYFNQKTLRMYSKNVMKVTQLHCKAPVELIEKICWQKRKDAIK